MDYEKDVPLTTLARYVVNPATEAFEKRLLSSRHVEFPSVSPLVSTKKHRYVYVSAGAKADGSSPTAGVLKVDTDDAALSQVYK